jgi:hypothetical protein
MSGFRPCQESGTSSGIIRPANSRQSAAFSVPTLTMPLADFVGQGKPIPVAQGTSSSGVVLEPHKLAVITPLSGPRTSR